MFDVSFGELLMVGLVAMLVFGPKELPKYLRKAGQFAGKLRAPIGTRSPISDYWLAAGAAPSVTLKAKWKAGRSSAG